MNVAMIFVFCIGLILAIANQGKNEGPESLCIVSNGKCFRNAEKNNFKPVELIEGYYCLNEQDFKKIVDKLNQMQNGQ